MIGMINGRSNNLGNTCWQNRRRRLSFLKRTSLRLAGGKARPLHHPCHKGRFKAAYATAYPDDKPAAIPNNAGKPFRFVHEMKKGDIVAYPSKMDRHIHLGRITGDYRYDPTQEAGYPNSRQVQWVTSVPRTLFSQGALYEIGSAMSLFQIKKLREEFLASPREPEP